MSSVRTSCGITLVSRVRDLVRVCTNYANGFGCAVGLDKWLAAIWLIANAKNGIYSYEIHRSLRVTQKSAWFMLHRIRLAMQNGSLNKLSGHVEVDETFIGSKARNMHRGDRARKIHGTGGSGKVAGMGLLEGHGEVRTMVVPNVRRRSLHGEVTKHVEQGATVHSDALKSYNQLEEYIHNVNNHAEKYVEGSVHTNGIENFWSLLKRTIGGTYYHLYYRVAPEPAIEVLTLWHTRRGASPEL